MTASTDPARKPARKPAAKKSTAGENLEPDAVKSPSARAATERAPARKTTVTRAEPRPVGERAARRRPVAKPPEVAETAPPARGPEMTRGILELAAERLAASQPRTPELEPPAPAPGDPMAAPGTSVGLRAAGGRRSSRSGGMRALPEAPRPPAPDNGWLGGPVEPEPALEVDEKPARNVYADDIPLEDRYPRTPNRRGLPPSLRLPAELPDNLWPPKNLLDRNLAENPPVTPRVESIPELAGRHHAPEFEPVTEERIYVPAASEPVPDEEPAPDFLPAVLSQHEVAEREEIDYVPAHSRPSPARHMVPESVTTRQVRRRRRAVLVAYTMVVLTALVVGHEVWTGGQPIDSVRDKPEVAQPAGEIGVPAGPTPAVTMTGAPLEEPTSKKKGKSGDFSYERSRGPMLGESGRLYRFRVAVEEVVEDTSPAGFAEVIDETLGDDRSWVHSGELRLRRAAKAGDDVDFTIYLASAKTSEKMCAAGGLDTDGYTSCRLPGKVIINAARWAGAVPEFGDRLTTYRRYTINHEVGHELGHGHEACPGKGEPAPVMQQQTFGLKGCTANAWPYLDGDRYQGKPIA
ncbi:DUF3152 domain-containing protein [Actinoplanes derwentensis]|uniref:DUF3152 domain-containing protein n=1 Tax=Actinoplanes derwentensis TaxID=113562 RepID=UPI001E3EAD93|nr:DUF3152 domain-containing protein [Actinoplanes derwentensis]